MTGGKGAARAAPTPDTNDRLASALEFAEIVPVVIVDGKNPGGLLGREWQRKATRDPNKVRQWFATWPDANVGVVPGVELLPIDVDNPESLAKLEEKAPAPRTPRYYTGGAPGRERLLFKHPGKDVLARLPDTFIAPGVQVRAPRSGGGALMSVVPPSTNPDSGQPYEWRVALDEAPLARMPSEWLPGRRARRGRTKSEWAEMFAKTFTAGCGETHPSFVSMAGRLVPAVGATAAAELLRCWNRAHCQPPKSDKEIVDAVAWVARKELGR